MKEFKSIERKFKDLIKRTTGFGPPLSLGEDGPIVGLQEDVKHLVLPLIVGRTTSIMVFIVRPRGIGKTTLAHKVYHTALACLSFCCNAWVSVPRQWVLSDERSWEVFNARVGFEIPTELGKVGRTIVRWCRGLPWAIFRLGDVLSKIVATEEQWYILGFLEVLLCRAGFKLGHKLDRLIGILGMIKDLIQRKIGIDQPVGDDEPFVGLEEDVHLLTSHLIADNAANRMVWIVGR
ncbi:unnamed protein product [Ilex paraguariensis]|uniref:Uncharacterized protein n=1 Tax=Ilex paraguariensis TaxID=185542 RepID=A0ABC8U127_9AQUA